MTYCFDVNTYHNSQNIKTVLFAIRKTFYEKFNLTLIKSKTVSSLWDAKYIKYRVNSHLNGKCPCFGYVKKFDEEKKRGYLRKCKCDLNR
jgi:hypothetical protein